MHIGQPRLLDSASAAFAAFIAWSSLMGSPYGMKVAFSGRASLGLLGSGGICAKALRANTANEVATAMRTIGLKAISLSSGKLTQRLDAHGDDLLVLVGLDSGSADAADADAVHHDRQPALHRRDFRHAEHGIAAGLDALFPHQGGAACLGRRFSLGDGGTRVERRGAVHADQVQQVAAVVEDGDRHHPVVLLRFGLGGGGHLAAVVEGQHRSCFHGCRACLICSRALGSSMVVRSPGSRPSASAWIERRSVLPERVFGSKVTKCTAVGRAMAPRCLSTVSMMSFEEVFFDASFS